MEYWEQKLECHPHLCILHSSLLQWSLVTETVNGGAVCKDVRETKERVPDTQKVKAKAVATGELGSVWEEELYARYKLK